MAKKLFVGGIPDEFTKEELEELFAAHGTVESTAIIIDRETGRSKNFGFVEMSTEEEADAAIKALNGFEVQNKKLVVNEARPKEERKPFGNNQGGGFSNRNGGGGGFSNRPRY